PTRTVGGSSASIGDQHRDDERSRKKGRTLVVGTTRIENRDFLYRSGCATVFLFLQPGTARSILYEDCGFDAQCKGKGSSQIAPASSGRRWPGTRSEDSGDPVGVWSLLSLPRCFSGDGAGSGKTSGNRPQR